jgi:hypothetical protein
MILLSHTDDQAVRIREQGVPCGADSYGAGIRIEQSPAVRDGERYEPIYVARINDAKADMVDTAGAATRLTRLRTSCPAQHERILSSRCLEQHDIGPPKHYLETEHVHIERR